MIHRAIPIAIGMAFFYFAQGQSIYLMIAIGRQQIDN